MIESLLLEQLKKNPTITGLLTSYGGEPAFFYQNAPMDTDPLWGGSCFPRIDFIIDQSRDPERQISGKLFMNVWACTENLSPDGGNIDRELETLLKQEISGTFYSPTVNVVVGAEWVQTMTFLGKATEKDVDSSEIETFGMTLEFDLIEFPQQITSTPDPVQGANAFIKKFFPEVTVIGEDVIPKIWKPSDENPAIYWRFRGYEGNPRCTYSVNWYMANLALHIFTDSVPIRNSWLKTITEQLHVEGEILLLDQSPMFLSSVKIFLDGDPLREGQFLLVGEFGVLASQRKEAAQYPLNHAKIKK